MEFRVLGPFEVISGTTPLKLRGRRPRALLARLLLQPGLTVSVDHLVDDLWGDEAPETAAKMVQIHVSQLRKALPADLLLTRPPGYVAEVSPETVDVTVFKALREQGGMALRAGDAATASAFLHDALALWRGPALAEFAEPFARLEGGRLEELRLSCLEDRIEADLALGLHADVVGELDVLIAEHPLREAAHGQLMLALYRWGRQAEALAAYDRFRRALDGELGIEPSTGLKTLQYRILNQDPRLELQAGAAPIGTRRPPPTTASAAHAASAADIFGRSGELALLSSALDAADQAGGSAVLIAGRGGIGKTRLVTELAGRARARGARVLSGQCIQLVGAGLPFLPFVDALRPVVGSSALRDLAGELRELPLLIRDLPSADDPAASGGPAVDSRLTLFEEVLAVLEHLSASRTLVLVLEDLHWADESTLDLVAFLAHALRGHRIVLVATHRSEEIRPGDPLQRLTSGLVGAGVAASLELEPLDREALEALLASHADELPAELVTSICVRSSGNPFFAKELLAATARGETLPAALRDLLLADVGSLDEVGQTVLRVAAAAGRDVPYGLLAAVLPLDDLELANALRRAVAKDILVADQASGTFRFRHPLFAEAVYGTLLPGEREALHARLARALTEHPRLAAGGTAAAEPAQHWAAAGRPAEALTASLLAARQAEAVSGLTEALGHVERVLDLWDEVPDAEELAGVALPAVLAWATELAGMSVQREDEMHSRLLLGIVGPDESVETETVAARLGVSTAAAAQALGALERDGLVERAGEGAFRVAGLGMTEARRLYPAAVVLESVAVRRARPFDRSALDELRRANARLRASVDDPAGAIAADDDFHRHLTAGCGNDELLAALRPVKRALLRYERVYMAEPARIAHSAEQHDAIIAALESGDHAEAAQLLRENLTRGLPALTAAVEG